MVVVLRGVRLDHRHSGRIRSTENNTQRFSRKNANTNDQPEIIVHVISHLQVSQIPKIKSKEGTGTWNPSRMTTFQGQSAKHHSNKKKFKSGQNQPNAIFIFITFFTANAPPWTKKPSSAYLSMRDLDENLLP